nr:PKD domain-containing protein [Algoriphagus locisalis]
MRNFVKGFSALLVKDCRLLALAVWGVLSLNFFTATSLKAQIISIPREGFPYCEPFTNVNATGGFDFTLLGGEIRIPVGVPENPTSSTIIKPYSAYANGNSLQLTPLEYWHSGYAIVDIPFSSQFGIKTSFEYFSYGAPDPRGNADGISFFMFDADQPLSLGYLGGSLAYAPYIGLDGTPLQPGIAGGYVGIGFDEWGNFGVGKVGEPIANWDPRIANSITVRGPETLNYDVYERYVTNKVNAFGVDYFPPSPLDGDPTKWFDIDHNNANRPVDCLVPGYRKVFIELLPNGSGYQIKIDMLVNTSLNGQQLVSFPLIDYPFNAPDRLKIGFAGSTGNGRNNHEIRNVTVNVADISEALLPLVSDQNKVICIDDDLEFEFPVVLQAGNDAFITCMQLFENDPGPPDNSTPPTNYTCGFDGSLCTDKCNPDNYEVPVYDASGNLLGTFYSILEELNTGNFEDERNKATIRFEPAPGFTGEASVYYNVTDNYGLTSEPAKITVVSNPFPVEIQDGEIDNPSCDGQQDGRIYDVIVGDLVVGFDYEWLHNGSSIGKSGATVSNLVNGEATFELTGVNLGAYTLNVWNPSDSQGGGCPVPVQVLVDQENGTPVTLDVPDKTICEGEVVSFLPLVDPADIPSGASPSFLWYQNSDRSGGALSNNSTITVSGNQVDVSISSSGELTLSGLKNTGGTSTFDFFVEAATQSQVGGNFCPYLGDVLTVASVTVNPPLSFTVSYTDDWCLTSAGEIEASVSGATDITYFLLDDADVVLTSNTSGTFTGLASGDYKVYGTSASLGCSSPVEDVTIEGPVEGLVIAPVDVENSYCGLPNGTISFEVSGGNIPYLSIELNGNPIPFDPSGIYEIPDLPPNSYDILITDAKGCTATMPMTVQADPPSNFTTIGSEVCEGQEASASIDILDSSTGLPTFNWYKDDGMGGYTLIPNSLIEGNIEYYVSPQKELFVTGLPASEDPYIFYLLVTGDKICDQGYIPTEIKVTPGPEMNEPILTETCYGESLGSIQAQIPGNNFNDFEFSIEGDNGITIDFSKNGGLFENLPAGSYELSIRSALGCITTLQDVEVLEPAEPISLANQSIERASCDLANGVIKDLQITGGWGDYTVEWRKGTIDGTVIPGSTTGAVDLLPDTYFLLVTDEKGCLESFEFVVGELSDPVYDLVPPIDVCLEEEVEIRPIHLAPDPSLPPAAFTEVFWYKNAGQNDLISNGADPSDPNIIYTIDDSDWLNPKLQIEGLPAGLHSFYFYVECTGQEIEVEVEVFDIPTVELETSLVSCFGGNDGKLAFISGTNDSYTYSIDSGTPVTQADLELMSFSAGEYNLQVLTPASCPQSLTFTIEGPEEPLVISPLVGINPGCGALNGKINATITGGWLPYTVSVLENGAVIQSLELSDSSLTLDGLASGSYSLIILDAQGCEITSPTLELVDGPSQILVDNQIVCEGQEVILTPTIDPAASDVVFEWYFDANTTQKINSNSIPDGNGVTYDINPTTGVLTINGLSASANQYEYFVLAQGPEVCPGFVGSGTAMVYSTPTATYTKTDEVCFEEGGSINVSAVGGSGNYIFVLDGQISQDNGLFENVPKGIHTVTITTPETCEVTLSSIEINGPDSPLEIEILAVDNPSCDLANGAITLGIQGGIAGYSVEVFMDNTSQGIYTADSNGEVQVLDIKKGEYAFIVTDASGCEISLSEPLDLEEVPTVITLEDQVICAGQDAVLQPEVPSNISSPAYTWFYDEAMTSPILPGQVNGITYQIESDGELTVVGLPESPDPYIYYAMVEGPEICGVTPKQVQVYVNSFPNLRVSNPSIVCDPQNTVDLTNYIEGYNPSIYEYSIFSPLGNALVGNEINAVNESGNYEVSASFKGYNCWTAPQRILVRIASELLQSNFEYHADLGGGLIVSNQDIQLLEIVEFEDFSTGDVLLWNWDFGDGTTSTAQNPNHIFQNKGSYTITLTTTDTIGCQSVYSVVVDVTDEYLLLMPNAFTPDGIKNQYYKPMHRGLASIEFYVFSTWGELIYHAESLEDLGWDGTFNGKPAPNGNYVYKVKYRTRTGNVFDEAGVFILIR